MKRLYLLCHCMELMLVGTSEVCPVPLTLWAGSVTAGCSWVLTTFKDGVSGHSIPVFDHLTTQKLFVVFKWNFQCSSLCPFPLVLMLDTLGGVWLHILCCPFQKFIQVFIRSFVPSHVWAKLSPIHGVSPKTTDSSMSEMIIHFWEGSVYNMYFLYRN